MTITLEYFTALPVQQKIETLGKLYKGEVVFSKNEQQTVEDLFKGFGMNT